MESVNAQVMYKRVRFRYGNRGAKSLRKITSFLAWMGEGFRKGWNAGEIELGRM